MISKEALEEYKKIYKKQFGEDVSDVEALAGANRLLSLMSIIYRPIPKEDYEEVIEQLDK
jgi:hypothetical protein